MASDKARDHRQWLVAALIGAAASVAGGAVTGYASYRATESSNQAVIHRDKREDQLAARSGARLVETELAQVAVRLGFLQKQLRTNASLVAALHRLHKQRGTNASSLAAALRTLRKQQRTNASSLAAALHRLPDTEWKANQRALARTLTTDDWGTVSQVYEFIEAFASEKQTLIVPELPIGLLKSEVSDARDALSPYE